MLGQLAVSITATIVASMILTGLQQEFVVDRGIVPQPELTSGGKFAARVEALRAAADETTPAVVTPPRVPVLVADAGLSALPVSLSLQADEARGPKPTGEPAKRTARAEPRHRAVADASLDVRPPRRSDSIPLAESSTASGTVEADALGVWSTTKGLYRQAVWLGGTVLDRVNPANLLP